MRKKETFGYGILTESSRFSKRAGSNVLRKDQKSTARCA